VGYNSAADDTGLSSFV